jgi:hypothetical protein
MDEYFISNEIKTYYCSCCEEKSQIVSWEYKYSRFCYICQNCKIKIKRRLLQIKRGY